MKLPLMAAFTQAAQTPFKLDTETYTGGYHFYLTGEVDDKGLHCQHPAISLLDIFELLAKLQ